MKRLFRLFSCQHKRISRVFTMKTGYMGTKECYQVCFDCGKKLYREF